MDTIQDYLDGQKTQVRHRSFSHTFCRGTDIRYASDGSFVYNVSGSNTALGYHQQTSSIEHPWRYFRDGTYRPRNMGGPFITTKLSVGLPSRKFWNLRRNFANGKPNYTYDGDLFPHIDVQKLAKCIKDDTIRSQAVWSDSNALNSSDLRVIGEQIMLSVVPTSHAFDATVALGEPISDGAFFGLPGRSLLLNSDPGGEYLNTVFGILPSVDEVKNFNTALDTYDRVIKQYLRDAGKKIRRRTKPVDIPEEKTVVNLVGQPPITERGSALTSILSQYGPCTITTTTNRKIWYSGAFEYFIPPALSAFERNIFEWQRAYGIAPSPVDIWNLLPFTWLSDWFSNGGNSLRHLFLQATEGATQIYGYVMCTSQVKKTYEWTGTLYTGSGFVPCSITAEVTKTIKQRARVSPFGVHFTGVDFTPRQLAILAALGVAK